MSFARYLSINSICLDIDLDYEIDTQGLSAREVEIKRKETILYDVAKLLDNSGKISNFSSLSKDLILCNRRTSSAIGCGVAIPHVRNLQTRHTVMGFARCKEGVDFDAPDFEKVQLFIPMVAPPYDDKAYLRIYRGIALAFQHTDVKQRLLEVQEPTEVIRIFDRYFR
ncbi:MAG: PTS sugar transporter subunit IIA [Planctomycetes bacterium]|jgi:PTS system fructose-specific IIC component|nr:PTS sugar transporter subunit IIA [Planctomycetota bacterium]HNZ66622.1 PTS sugar transporter subunit IIA [Planctomycetota bacterium]HON44905.1 PTS sugar transporter subunit IIA [Planctomycetota bacterium]HPY75496.1 PTS sugar transporter subunit IIA [Planctomycetota bacterium]HQB00337.1 PTS sugar transporter subunit IIA [Planctomycetota bacterium]